MAKRCNKAARAFCAFSGVCFLMSGGLTSGILLKSGEIHGKVRITIPQIQNRRYEAYAILNAGGAYGAVCTMVEALPAAAKLNELGMDCFCLNYRTATQSSFTEGLMPKPLEDLALAWRYIESNEAAFQLDAENYIVGGFSAGGHLAAMWGAENHGARRFGIPNPRALLLAYPLIELENLSGPAAQLLRSGLLGIHSGEEKIAEYPSSLW